jgi:hypothetical protein
MLLGEDGEEEFLIFKLLYIWALIFLSENKVHRVLTHNIP